MTVAVFFLCVLFSVLLVRRVLSGRAGKAGGDPFQELRSPDADIGAFEEEARSDAFEVGFFERCRAGEARQVFLKVASMQDCALIQALLDSAGVPSLREHQHMNGLYGSAASSVSYVFSVRLWILTADYDVALEVVTQFLRQKSEALKEGAPDSALGKAAGVALGLLAAPFPATESQQILGITVFPRAMPQ